MGINRLRSKLMGLSLGTKSQKSMRADYVEFNIFGKVEEFKLYPNIFSLGTKTSAHT